MVTGRSGADDRPMTTEQHTTPRTLRRRSDDRVIGGVASGLGDYLNVDPLLIRIGFVGLMVFGGMGLLLYVAAWLLVPDDTTDRSVIERTLGRSGLGGGILAIVLILVGLSVVFNVFGGVAGDSGGVPALAFAAVVIVVGAAILRRGDSSPVPAASAAEPAAAPAPAPTRVVRPRRPPSPLGGYVMGATLASVGLLALALNVTGAAVDLGQFFGLALGVIGIGLIVGTWWGHARWLILIGLLVLPFAITASFINVPIEGGFGSHRFGPTDSEELRDEYRLVGGRIRLDLTDVEAGSEPIVIDASVAMGEIFVRLPADAGAELDTSVGAGELFILDAYNGGTSVEDRQVIEGDGTQFILRLDAGVGAITIKTAPSEDR